MICDSLQSMRKGISAHPGLVIFFLLMTVTSGALVGRSIITILIYWQLLTQFSCAPGIVTFFMNEKPTRGGMFATSEDF
jgi:hypothetical protein